MDYDYVPDAKARSARFCTAEVQWSGGAMAQDFN